MHPLQYVQLVSTSEYGLLTFNEAGTSSTKLAFQPSYRKRSIIIFDKLLDKLLGQSKFIFIFASTTAVN